MQSKRDFALAADITIVAIRKNIMIITSAYLIRWCPKTQALAEHDLHYVQNQQKQLLCPCYNIYVLCFNVVKQNQLLYYIRLGPKQLPLNYFTCFFTFLATKHITINKSSVMAIHYIQNHGNEKSSSVLACSLVLAWW